MNPNEIRPRVRISKTRHDQIFLITFFNMFISGGVGFVFWLMAGVSADFHTGASSVDNYFFFALSYFMLFLALAPFILFGLFTISSYMAIEDDIQPQKSTDELAKEIVGSWRNHEP